MKTVYILSLAGENATGGIDQKITVYADAWKAINNARSTISCEEAEGQPVDWREQCPREYSSDTIAAWTDGETGRLMLIRAVDFIG